MPLSRLLSALACTACLLAAPAHAMEFHLVGDTLVMSGPVDGADLARLPDHLVDHKIKLVLLHQIAETGAFLAALQPHPPAALAAGEVRSPESGVHKIEGGVGF